jgi:hypothetical protein
LRTDEHTFCQMLHYNAGTSTGDSPFGVLP